MICGYYTEGRDHIKKLLKENFLIEYGPDYSNVNKYGPVFAVDPWGFRTCVYISDINNNYTYWAALHEIGHVLHPNCKSFLEKVRLNPGFDWRKYPGEYILDNESYAWEWALENSVYSTDEYVLDLIKYCLGTYQKDYAKNIKSPPKSSLYYAIGNH